MKEKEYKEFIKEWEKDNEELIKSGKCKKVFIECLPKKGYRIDWEKSIGYILYFIDFDKRGHIEIVDNIDVNKVAIKYDNNIINMKKYSIIHCKLNSITNRRNGKYFKYNINDIINDNNKNTI